MEMLEILPKCFIFLSLPAPHYHVLSLRSIMNILAKFFISLSLPPSPLSPYQDLWLIHFGYINKIFHFPWPSSQALWLWWILDISKFFIFPSALPFPLPSSVTLIHFEHTGKTFHFFLTILPPTMVCDFDLFGIYWQNFSFFPHPLPPSLAPWLWSILDISAKF